MAKSAAAFTALRCALRSINPFRRATLRPHSFTPRPLNQHDYHRMMLAFSDSKDSEAVLRLFRHMKISNCSPDAFIYSTVVKSLLDSNQPQQALSMFDDMLSSGISLTLHCYTLLVKIYACHLGRFDWARELLTWMAEQGCEPTVVTYSTLIDGLCKAGKIGDALDVFDEMLRKGCKPNQHTFASFLQAYCSKGKVKEAKELIDSMLTHDCKPNVVIYNILIRGLCVNWDFDEVERIIETSKENGGWDPDAVTYCTYIAGLCNAGLVQEAFLILDRMVQIGLEPTNIGMNIFLDSLGEQMDVFASRFILESFQKLGFDVDIISYNTVMSHLCKRAFWVDNLNLFTVLFKKGFEPDSHTFNILIKSFCRAGKYSMIKTILEFEGFEPDVVTCNILLNHFYKSGENNELGLLLNYVQEKSNNLSPDIITYGTLIDGLCRSGKTFEAIHFVRNVENYEYNTELVALLTYWLVRIGKTVDALELFEEMWEKGLVLENRVFDRLITGFCRKGGCEGGEEKEKMEFVLDKMLGIY